MSLVNKIKNLSKTEKIVMSSIAAVVVIAIVVGIIFFINSKYLATTMRLLRVEGTVNIEDSSGSVKPVIDNIRFQSGDALSTGDDGLASVGLDDTKIVTLENNSRAEFIKNNKQLELKLTQGALFFEVTEKLQDDELYEIKTSNMTIGIRGTSGYVYYDENGLESVIITDGSVRVSAYNPKTGETKTIDIHGGNKITCYLYSDSTEERDSIEFELSELAEEDLPFFPLKMLVENDHLIDKVCEYTGWKKEKLIALFNAFLDPDTPTPTPDEIITITDTPTPTDKPTVIPTTLPTDTPTPTPTPSSSILTSPSTTPGVTTTTVPVTTTATANTSTTTVTPTVIPTVTTTQSSTVVTVTTTTPKPTTSTAPKGTSYTVTFITNGKCTAPNSQTVTSGGKATKPANPSATGYTFGGWYKDSACTNEYDFNSAVTSNITLYAKWTAVSDTTTPTPTDEPTNTPVTITPPELPADVYWFAYDESNNKYAAYVNGYGTQYYVYINDEIGWVQAIINSVDYGDYYLSWLSSSYDEEYFTFKEPKNAPDGYSFIVNEDAMQIYVSQESSGALEYQVFTQNSGWITGYAETTDSGAKTTYFYLDSSGNRVDYYTKDN